MNPKEESRRHSPVSCAFSPSILSICAYSVIDRFDHLPRCARVGDVLRDQPRFRRLAPPRNILQNNQSMVVKTRKQLRS